MKIRELEGMEQYTGWVQGAERKAQGVENEDQGARIKEQGIAEIVENGIRYKVDFVAGQKTGFFLDQKYNRKAVARIAKGRKVLDCFTHTGSFALNALQGGAARVTAVDISGEALKMAKENAKLNDWEYQ